MIPIGFSILIYTKFKQALFNCMYTDVLSSHVLHQTITSLVHNTFLITIIPCHDLAYGPTIASVSRPAPLLEAGICNTFPSNGQNQDSLPGEWQNLDQYHTLIYPRLIILRGSYAPSFTAGVMGVVMIGRAPEPS
jgi:hypothetical protein